MTTDTALALLRDAAGNLYMAYNAFTRNDAIAWEPLKETADRITALLAALIQQSLIDDGWRSPEIKAAHGCHCDIESMDEGFQPDGCVLDDGSADDCIYATKLVRDGKGKESCEYWKPITVHPRKERE